SGSNPGSTTASSPVDGHMSRYVLLSSGPRFSVSISSAIPFLRGAHATREPENATGRPGSRSSASPGAARTWSAVVRLPAAASPPPRRRAKPAGRDTLEALRRAERQHRGAVAIARGIDRPRHVHAQYLGETQRRQADAQPHAGVVEPAGALGARAPRTCGVP